MPRKHPTRTAILQVRVTPQAKKQLDRLAAKKGIYLSDYCWGVLDSHCKRKRKK